MSVYVVHGALSCDWLIIKPRAADIQSYYISRQIRKKRRKKVLSSPFFKKRRHPIS